MSFPPRFSPTEVSPAEVSPRLHATLYLLLEAYRYALEFGRSVWDFAVEIQTLRPAGPTNNEFRWLVCKGYVQHAAEVTRPEADARTFSPVGPLTFTDHTCFVLTEAGAGFAGEVCDRPAPASRPVPAPAGTVPHWDPHRQELSCGGVLVKQFKVPAPNQELVLSALEEEQWPPRIDDPLPPRPNLDAKRRLHDTINSLNRNQKHPLLHFSGDGKGEGVLWEMALEAAALNGQVC